MFIASWTYYQISFFVGVIIVIYSMGLMLTWKMLSVLYRCDDKIPWHVRFLPLFSFAGMALFFVGLIVHFIGLTLYLLVTGKHWGETP